MVWNSILFIKDQKLCIYLHVDSLKIKMIDSLNFLNMPLKEIPDMLYKKDEIKSLNIKKGDFSTSI